MRVLLDTHALLWWLSDDDQLGPRARDLIADDDNDILISVVSLWEVIVKIRVGKLTGDLQEIVDAVGHHGFTLLNITVGHLLATRALPIHHRDPFDHLLIGQAIVEHATFLSEDANTRRYPVLSATCSG